MASLDESYDEFPRIEQAFQEFLDGSLSPRGPDSLFDLVATLDLPAGGLVIDVGCGEGHEAIELVKRFGFRIHGFDPVQRNIDVAAALARDEGLGASVEFELGTAEDQPIPDATADLVW